MVSEKSFEVSWRVLVTAAKASLDMTTNRGIKGMFVFLFALAPLPVPGQHAWVHWLEGAVRYMDESQVTPQVIAN